MGMDLRNGYRDLGSTSSIYWRHEGAQGKVQAF